MKLRFFGVDRYALFPDLDGLSQQIRWDMLNQNSFVEPYVDSDYGIPDPLGVEGVDLGDSAQLELLGEDMMEGSVEEE